MWHVHISKSPPNMSWLYDPWIHDTLTAALSPLLLIRTGKVREALSSKIVALRSGDSTIGGIVIIFRCNPAMLMLAVLLCIALAAAASNLRAMIDNVHYFNVWWLLDSVNGCVVGYIVCRQIEVMYQRRRGEREREYGGSWECTRMGIYFYDAFLSLWYESYLPDLSQVIDLSYSYRYHFRLHSWLIEA